MSQTARRGAAAHYLWARVANTIQFQTGWCGRGPSATMVTHLSMEGLHKPVLSVYVGWLAAVPSGRHHGWACSWNTRAPPARFAVFYGLSVRDERPIVLPVFFFLSFSISFVPSIVVKTSYLLFGTSIVLLQMRRHTQTDPFVLWTIVQKEAVRSLVVVSFIGNKNLLSDGAAGFRAERWQRCPIHRPRLSDEARCVCLTP